MSTAMERVLARRAKRLGVSPKKREKPRPSGLGRKAQVPPTAEQACISIRFVVA
jgi:hypothetical protein